MKLAHLVVISALGIAGCQRDAVDPTRQPISPTASMNGPIDMKNSNIPATKLQFEGPSPSVRMVAQGDLPDEVKKLRDKLASDPAWQARMQRQQIIANRGLPTVLLLEQPLPEGAIAQAILDPNADESRVLAVSKVGLTDELFSRARHAVQSYEMNNRDPRYRTVITLWPDGRVRIAHGSVSREFMTHVEYFGTANEAGLVTRKLEELAAKSTAITDPKLGKGFLLRNEAP